ncbi:MAG: hypothetical protein KDD45_12255 [Bdellovibrionales bacterium]|nr:hypothetical protein [Bdellovibrionales bacterium]
MANVPVLIFANKQDLVQALQPDEILQELRVEKLGDRKWTITACSAKTQEGLEDGLTWLV